MKRVFLLLFAGLLFIACDSPEQNSAEVLNKDIEITDAIRNREQICLSELVDSISFLPLETTPKSLIGIVDPVFTQSYLWNQNACFTWDGNFVRSFGTKGRGPLEEFYGVFHVMYVSGYFLARGLNL